MLTLNPGDHIQFTGTALNGRPQNPAYGEVGVFVRFDMGCAVVRFPSMPDGATWLFNAEEIAEVGTVLHPAEAFVRELLEEFCAWDLALPVEEYAAEEFAAEMSKWRDKAREVLGD